jgi:hypothetical protein
MAFRPEAERVLRLSRKIADTGIGAILRPHAEIPDGKDDAAAVAGWAWQSVRKDISRSAGTVVALAERLLATGRLGAEEVLGILGIERVRLH